MVIIKKIFHSGLNSDSSPKTLGEGQMLNLQGARWGVSEDGRNNRLESCRSTSLISQTVLPSGTHLTLGSTIDDARKRILYFDWNSGGEHGIYCYDQPSGNSYRVLSNSQVDGGLNFSKNTRIDRNARVVGDMLYFTDGTENGQRKVNIEAGIKLNHSDYTTNVAPYAYPVDFREITLIKPPPALAPSIQKDYDNTFPNSFIANESFSFAFQYTYVDNETSVIGAYSIASRLNKNSDNYNRIIVKMGAGEFIPNTVSIVSLVVRLGNSAFEIRTWDRRIALDATAIINHNAGTSSLTFNFYNNNTGKFIPQGDILKPFDSVPRRTKTIEFAKDRLFLGNNLDGYDTPVLTSLTSSQATVPITASVLSKSLFSVRWRAWNRVLVGSSYVGHYKLYSGWYLFVNINEIPGTQSGYYLITSTEHTGITGTNGGEMPDYDNLAATPTATTISGLTFKGVTQEDVLTMTGFYDARNSLYVSNTYPSFGSTEYIKTSSVCTVTGLSVNTFDVFKTRAQYQAGVVFYDFAMRKCGVVKAASIISIPPRDYSFNNAIQSVTVSVSNKHAVDEIPAWAYYYAFVRTLNLKTRFFIQSFDSGVRYATKSSTGEFKFDQVTFVTGCVALAIDTTALVQAGLGYSFSEGDICNLITSSGSSFNIDRGELSVIGQSGKYILLKPIDVGDTTTMTAMYEINTPYKASEQEPFYEFGHIYKVLNPTKDDRQYSTTSDIMLPDAYVLTRNYLSSTYFAEAMCPNDLFYKRWDNDGGKVNLVTKLGERNKIQSVYWSNTFLAGTAVNGLSTFEALNQKSLPIELGEITKLQSANKIAEQGQGSVMLAICASSQTVSLYLGEVQLSASAKTSDIIRSDEVIGSINVLSGSFGTTHPESVIEFGGLVFWVDTTKRAMVQYSGNGLDSISKFGMVRFFEKYIKQYENTASSAIDTLNGFHHIPTAIDPSFRKELLVITPALASESAMTDLPSYSGVPSFTSSIKNRFDVSDGQGKAIGYSIEGNIWQHTYPFVAEHFDYIGNNFYGFKDGQLHLMDGDNTAWNKFFGVTSPIRLCFPINEIVGGDCEILNIALEGNAAPTFSVAYSDSPNVQITDLILADFIPQGTGFFAKFFRDRLSPISGSVDEKLFKGDPITGYPVSVMLEWNVNDRMVVIDAIDIGVEPSRGLKQIIQK